MALMSGCVFNTSDDVYDEEYVEDEYIEDVYIDDSAEDITESETEVFEETEETTTTTTTTVENPPKPTIDEVTCSAEDQGFGGAEFVDAFVVTPPANCDWRDDRDTLSPDAGLGFIDVLSDDEYISLFTCTGASVTSDINWGQEVIVYITGWIPAGSNPNFEWAVSPSSGEIVLGLVSQEVCTNELEFYQNAFITPRRSNEPRVISCVMPTDC
jgi:hypothetical protein